MGARLETWSYEEVRTVMRLFGAKRVFRVEIHGHLIELCNESSCLKAVRIVREWPRWSSMMIASVGPAHQGRM